MIGVSLSCQELKHSWAESFQTSCNFLKYCVDIPTSMHVVAGIVSAWIEISPAIDLMLAGPSLVSPVSAGRQAANKMAAGGQRRYETKPNHMTEPT